MPVPIDGVLSLRHSKIPYLDVSQYFLVYEKHPVPTVHVHGYHRPTPELSSIGESPLPWKGSGIIIEFDDDEVLHPDGAEPNSEPTIQGASI